MGGHALPLLPGSTSHPLESINLGAVLDFVVSSGQLEAC